MQDYARAHGYDDRRNIDPLARAIYAKTRALEARHLSLSVGDRARFRGSISDDIKKVANFVTPEVSEADHTEAMDLGVELSEMNWHDQPRFDAGRQVFTSSTSSP